MSQRKEFIGLIQMYSEIGVNFKNFITNDVWKEWIGALQSTIQPEGLMLTKYKDHTLDFYICATALKDELDVRGPLKGRKNKYVEYFLKIPYTPVVSDKQSLLKLTQYFKQGVEIVLKKLEYSEQAISKFLEAI
jgi:hypothetical protein